MRYQMLLLVLQNILTGTYPIPEHVSKSCKDLLSKIFVVDPSKVFNSSGNLRTELLSIPGLVLLIKCYIFAEDNNCWNKKAPLVSEAVA